MITVEREVDRFLTLLRNKIREKGFTQLEVQEALGWGRSYISQLLTKQKALRFEQVVLILHVIGIDPGAFFRELYGEAPTLGTGLHRPSPRSEPPRQQVEEVTAQLQGLTALLIDRGLITRRGLSEAVAEQHAETRD